MSSTQTDAIKSLDQQAADQKAAADRQAKYFQSLQSDTAKLKQAVTTLDTALANDEKARADLKNRRDKLVLYVDNAASPNADVQAKINAYQTKETDADKAGKDAATQVDNQQKRVDAAKTAVTVAEAALKILIERDATITAALGDLEGLLKKAEDGLDTTTQMAIYVVQRRLDSKQDLDTSVRKETFDAADYRNNLNQAWDACAAAYMELREAQKALDEANYHQQQHDDATKQLTADPVNVLLATQSTATTKTPLPENK